MPLDFIIGIIIGSGIGICLMCLLQINRVDSRERKKIKVLKYLKKYSSTNAKGKTEYDKGYAEGLEYAYEMIKEELQ